MGTVSFALFFLAASVGFWFSETVQRAYFDLVRAGLFDTGSRQAFKTACFGAVVCFLCTLLSNQRFGVFDSFALMLGGALMSTTTRVVALVGYHGVDSKLAIAMADYYSALEAAPASAKRFDEDEMALQAYLDATYGRGKASARAVLSKRRGPKPSID